MNGNSYKYTSGWYTVGLPVIEFFAVWWGLSAFFFAMLNWNTSGFIAFLIITGTLVAAIVSCALTYPALMKMADRGSAELIVEGNSIIRRHGRKTHAIDLSHPYRCEISAGMSGLGNLNATIDLQQGDSASLTVHLHNALRDAVISEFPAPWFVDALAITPSEGSWGFELENTDPQSSTLFNRLLRLLWATRFQNSLFMIYSAFPWDTPPRQRFTAIQVIETESITADQKALIEGIRNSAVSSPLPWVTISPDYILGYHYGAADFIKDLLKPEAGEPERYYVIPLGHASAETTPPLPDLKSFLAANTILAAIGGGSIPLRHSTLLVVNGSDAHGHPLKVAFQWASPGDEGHEECKACVRFINYDR